jgi:hypothetical protein
MTGTTPDIAKRRMHLCILNTLVMIDQIVATGKGKKLQTNNREFTEISGLYASQPVHPFQCE